MLCPRIKFEKYGTNNVIIYLYLGECNAVYFPDYTAPRTQLWWIEQIQEFHERLQWDGLWIDMNEPSNFVAGDEVEVSDCTVGTAAGPLLHYGRAARPGR